MHDESMNEMGEFKANYVKPGARVLDVGSYDVNGSYKTLFDPGFYYMGLDIVAGPNVDVLAEDPYAWPIKDGEFDHVISGQAFEHIEFPDRTMKEIARVLAPDGYCCIIAPSSGPEHDYPRDYRRYNADDLRKLAEDAGLSVVSSVVNDVPLWNDAVLIAKKGDIVEADKPINLNLGCGLRRFDGFVNIDNRKEVNPDMVWDIARHGLPYDENMVDVVVARDFLEHIAPDRVIFVIEEIWRVLKVGGRLEHMTPSTDGRGAFQDPTHRSFWNKNSWMYYSMKDARELIGTKANFKIIAMQDQLTSDDMRIIHTHGILEKIGAKP